MAWRSHFFEAYAYRALFKEYFAKGARWTAAPRPQLLDDLYDNHYSPPPNKTSRCAISSMTSSPFSTRRISYAVVVISSALGAT